MKANSPPAPFFLRLFFPGKILLLENHFLKIKLRLSHRGDFPEMGGGEERTGVGMRGRNFLFRGKFFHVINRDGSAAGKKNGTSGRPRSEPGEESIRKLSR